MPNEAGVTSKKKALQNLKKKVPSTSMEIFWKGGDIHLLQGTSHFVVQAGIAQAGDSLFKNFLLQGF